jgi:hypothetical protein
MFSEFARAGSVPLEVWIGTAQTVEDASGQSVILNEAILEPIKDLPTCSFYHVAWLLGRE